MLLEYISKTYEPGEPIFLQDIDIAGMSAASIRQNMKKLVDVGAIERFDQGIYYIPVQSRLKGKRTLSPELVARNKYIARKGQIMGYYSGHTLANKMGLSTQVPVKEEIVSNNMAAIIREVEVGGRAFVVKKAPVLVNEANYKTLQLLEILKDIDGYCDDDCPKAEIVSRYIRENAIKRSDVERYITAFPLKAYKTIFDMRLDYVFA